MARYAPWIPRRLTLGHPREGAQIGDRHLHRLQLQRAHRFGPFAVFGDDTLARFVHYVDPAGDKAAGAGLGIGEPLGERHMRPAARACATTKILSTFSCVTANPGAVDTPWRPPPVSSGGSRLATLRTTKT